ncbi:hypothetical protein HMPREF0072_1048 [Anaerococcus lactolyticus ATCC 51172]|uniref:Uncharacterized protein n=1 Tax=Anaerococcus lactolyticus ATCC 51172 TaxID=525254 RepID=C2BFC8_9FIRM|nr:hypothetical protein HMPREF0072_1048 [Anaerococcus lactolyticus ATCC 51172]
MENNLLKQGLCYTNTFAEDKLLVPREWSPGGGNGRGFKGDPMREHPALAAKSDETFPRGPLFTKIQ